MKASITVTLIDQVTDRAKAAKAALEGLTKAAGTQAKEAGKAAASKVEAATKAAKDAAKEAAKAPAKEAITKAKEAVAPKKAAPRPTLDYLRSTGDAPEPLPPKPKPQKSGAKPDTKGMKPLGFASLAELPAEASEAGSRSSGIVANAISSARRAVATGVARDLAGRVGDLASNAVTDRVNEALAPLRDRLEQMKADFPQFAPIIDNVQGHFEGLAATATAFAGNTVGNVATSVVTRIGTMAAGLISLPALAIAGTVLIMARWSHVKDFFAGLFARLPQPVQAAMSRIGAILAATPLGALARGFDAMATYVQKVFDAITSDAADKWDQLKSLLVDNPLSAISGAWDGVTGYFVSLWGSITGFASRVGEAFRSIPARLAGIGAAIVNAVIGGDFSGVSAAAQRVIDAFMDIPAQLVALGSEIAAKIGEGDWAGAAQVAVDGLTDGFRNILARISDLGAEIIAKFKSISLVDAGLSMISSLWEGMKRGFEALLDNVSRKISNLKATISGMTGIGNGTSGGVTTPSGLQKRAKGGPVSAGDTYLVGEEGQELFVPDQSGRIIDAAHTRRMLSSVNLPAAAPASSLYTDQLAMAVPVTGTGGAPAPAQSSQTSNTFHITVQGARADDPEEFARRMWAEIERSTRGLLHDGVST